LKVKICGITRKEDLLAAVEGGADAVGFVVGFEDSPRDLDLDAANKLIALVPPFVTPVLVTNEEFVRMHYEEVKRMKCIMQLYGSDAIFAELKRSGFKLIKPFQQGRFDVENWKSFDALLCDNLKSGYGGTGEKADWLLCAKLRELVKPKPLILAGGLNPDNVVEAISRVRPYAVDVSSGVEASPGVKDRAKIRRFIMLAKGMM